MRFRTSEQFFDREKEIIGAIRIMNPLAGAHLARCTLYTRYCLSRRICANSLSLAREADRRRDHLSFLVLQRVDYESISPQRDSHATPRAPRLSKMPLRSLDLARSELSAL